MKGNLEGEKRVICSHMIGSKFMMTSLIKTEYHPEGS